MQSASGGSGERQVSSFELFFDLVFVFGFTQVTTSLAQNLTWTGLGHGVLVFGVLWWAWGAYAWLTNAVPTEGPPRLVVLGAMASMLVVALAVPTAFDGSGAAFPLACLLVMAFQPCCSWWPASAGTPPARRSCGSGPPT